MAALIGIPYSYVSPKAYIETNINGTYNVLQAAKELNLEKILITSTSEVYGTAQYVPIDEQHPKQPQSPYSASKISADAIGISFYNAFNLPVTIVRPFNTYGPRQSARAIIPTIISQIATGNKSIIIGNPNPTRDFTFVKDTCNGILKIAQCEKLIGREVNVASGNEISISELFFLIKEIINCDVRFRIEKQRIRQDKSEVFRLLGDASLLKNLTDFNIDYDLRKGLRTSLKIGYQKR